MSVDACKRPLCPHSRNSRFVGAPKIALKTQLGQNCVPTSNVALSSPGSTCTNPFALGLPAEARSVASTSRQGTAVTSLVLTTPPLTYSSVVTGVAERCYRGKSADSKWFAPEIRGSAAQIRSKTTINDKRRGTSRVEPQDGPSERLPSRAAHVTHRVTLTPLPGTAPAAGKSPQQTVRGPDAPPHTPQANIQNFPSGRTSP